MFVLTALLLLPQTATPGLPARDLAPVPRIERLNPPGTSYIDHEVHPELPEMVFQSQGEVWTGAIDPATGLFVSATGRDSFVDQATSLAVAKNGPEYGLDRDGWSLFYNRGLPGGVRIWRATPQAGQWLREPVTLPGIDRINPLPSQWADAETTWLLYARADPSQPPGVIAWADESEPTIENDITRVLPGFAGFRWQKGGGPLLTSTVGEGPLAGQVLLIDASTGEERVITNDPGVKFDPFPWYPPEFQGDLAVSAIVDNGTIAIYRNTGGAVFERYSTLEPPASAAAVTPYAQSSEPFVVGARSYISLTLKDDPGSIFQDVTESQIWVYSIEDGPRRRSLRCDDGADGIVRHEAETMIGNGQLYLYYNQIAPDGRFDIYLCRTGLRP